MFDLEQAIADWRRQMLAAGVKSPAPLDELESHLRDEIERQMKSGLDGPQAFKIAVQATGPARELQNEFSQVEETPNAGKFEIMFATVASLMPLFVGGMVLLKIGSLSQMAAGQRMSSLAAVAMFSLLAWGGRLGHGMFPVVRAKRIRDAVAVSCVVSVALWWLVFFHLIVPRHDFTIGELGVTIIWAFVTPAGGVIGLIWGIETRVREGMSPTRA